MITRWIGHFRAGEEDATWAPVHSGSMTVEAADPYWARQVQEYVRDSAAADYDRWHLSLESLEVADREGQVWQLEGVKLWSIPLAFGWSSPRPPWWARLITWGIVVYYAVRR